MKKALCLVTTSALLCLPGAYAVTITQSYEFLGLNLAIPDGDPSGLANVQSISGSNLINIENVTVTLNVSGSWSGDLYATLQHSSGFAVLLNRVGRTSSDAFGYGDSGMSIIFNDQGGFADVHTYQDLVGPQSPLTGTWASDGRAIDPDLVVDTDPRDALLDEFTGLDINGDWTLFMADLSGGDSHQLNDWALEVTGTPEPGTGVLALLGLGVLLRRRR